MHPRRFLGVLLSAGVLAGCGTTNDAGAEQAPALTGALDACDGTTAWEYNYFDDSSKTNQVGGIICKCRGVIQTWGDTSTPYTTYWSERCGGGEALR
ncbi:hypothetical protein LZ198_15005 [Myxococcus sp. K15C18031901]|uniref:hypothetical protein n=1 Tax=Myxococcus dinghuensis TaxID=2906761 RepID=UPI0020A71A26|nr:hypothetical protein [Myxococcus dinghuensis]MCP3100181.1 hypothetical protein [Myxococcus dinghuensis]